MFRQGVHCMRRGTVIGEAVARMLVGIGVGATITGIAVAAPQASSAQNLFKPGVARALDATIVRIIKQAGANLYATAKSLGFDIDYIGGLGGRPGECDSWPRPYA